MAKTVIHNQHHQPMWGEEDHLQVAQKESFAGMIFELLSERKAQPIELEIFELLLNLMIDHGPNTPSALATIDAARQGKTISEAVAAGILQINEIHGGAIEPAMELFYALDKGELTVIKLVEEYLIQNKRIPGFGHRIYQVDPRAQLILNKLQEAKLGENFINLAQKLEAEIAAQKGKHIPLNIDGAVAVALCSLGWNPRLGKAVFIIARTPGLCGQFLNAS